MKAMIRLVTLTLLLLPTLSAINFKVTKVDAKEGKVRLLLPMHSMIMEAKVVPKGEKIPLIESRIISRHSKQREDCFQKAAIKRGLRRMRRRALRARSLSSP